MILHIHVYKSKKRNLVFLIYYNKFNIFLQCVYILYFIWSCNFIKITTCIYYYIFFFLFIIYIININILQIYYVNIKLYNHINYKIINSSHISNRSFSSLSDVRSLTMILWPSGPYQFSVQSSNNSTPDRRMIRGFGHETPRNSRLPKTPFTR